MVAGKFKFSKQSIIILGGWDYKLDFEWNHVILILKNQQYFSKIIKTKIKAI